MRSVTLAPNQPANRASRIEPTISKTISSPLPRAHLPKSLSDVMANVMADIIAFRSFIPVRARPARIGGAYAAIRDDRTFEPTVDTAAPHPNPTAGPARA